MNRLVTVSAVVALLVVVAAGGCGQRPAELASEHRVDTRAPAVEEVTGELVGDGEELLPDPALDLELESGIDLDDLGECLATGIASRIVIEYEALRLHLEGRPIWADWEATVATILAQVPVELRDEIEVIRQAGAEAARAYAATSRDLDDPAVLRQLDANYELALSPPVAAAAEAVERFLLACPDL